MEIEVGEYIRTKDGRIEKVKVVNKYGIIHKHDNDNDTFDTGINWYAESGREINEEDIVKHSKNIYDLIEHEDIVILEYYVQKYGKRIQRKFDVKKYDDEGLYFENAFNYFIYKKAEKGFIYKRQMV